MSYPRSLEEWREGERRRKQQEEWERKQREHAEKLEQLEKEKKEQEERERQEREEKRSQPIVIDHGSYLLKAGFAHQNAPSALVPALVGRPHHSGPLVKSIYVGFEAQVKARILKLRCPLENGHITHIDDMEPLWDSVYRKLGANPEAHPVVMTEKPFFPDATRHKIAEIFFEKLNVPAMYFGIQSVFSMYASGRTTGLVLDSGENITYAIPIMEFKIETARTKRIDIAGEQLNHYLKCLLAQRGYVFSEYTEMEIVRDIKEKLCYVPLDFEAEYAKDSKELEAEYVMPDKQVIKLGRERFLCPEILFQPYHLDPIQRAEQFGIHEMIYEAIMDCEITERRELWANILLAGGSTCFKGLPERIKHELAPYDLTKGITVIASPDRKFSAFMGACMVASHSSFPQLAVSKEKYSEGGANELAKFSTEFKE